MSRDWNVRKALTLLVKRHPKLFLIIPSVHNTSQVQIYENKQDTRLVENDEILDPIDNGDNCESSMDDGEGAIVESPEPLQPSSSQLSFEDSSDFELEIREVVDIPTVHATRSKFGIFKPNPKYVLALSPNDISIPKSPKETLLISEWKAAMIEEFEALKKTILGLWFHQDG